MRDAELVEMVNVSETENDGREEDDRCIGGFGQEEKRGGSGAEENFFSYWALYRL